MHRFRRLALAVLAAGLTVLFAPAAAHASVTPGAFCADAKIGQYDKTEAGAWMRCTKEAGEKQARWRASSAPDAGQGLPGAGQPTKSERKPDGRCLESEAGHEFSTPGKLYVCQNTNRGYRWTLVTGGDDQPGTLPKTGVDATIAAGTAAALLAAGGGLVWAARRRRTRFQA